MKRSISLSVVSVAALFAFSATFVATASAADREISVQSKNKRFKVIDEAKAENTDVATTDENLPTKRPQIQEFRVNDEQEQVAERPSADENIPPKKPQIQEFRVDDENDVNEQAEATPVQRPDRPKVKQFRVDDEDQQAAEAIADDQVEVSQLRPEFKPKAPKPQIEQPELTNDEDETDQSSFDSADESSDDEVDPHVYVGKKVYQVRYPRRYVSYNNYRHVKRHSYGYRSNDSGAACNNNNGY